MPRTLRDRTGEKPIMPVNTYNYHRSFYNTNFRWILSAALSALLFLCPTLAALAEEEAGTEEGASATVSQATPVDGEDSKYYRALAGKPGDTVEVWVPIIAEHGDVSNVRCVLNAGALPAQIEAGDTVATLPDGGDQLDALTAGQRAYFKTSVKIKSDAKPASVKLNFQASYTKPDGSAATADLVLPVIVQSTATATPAPSKDSSEGVDYGIVYDSGSSGGGGSSFKSKPKVIVSGYTFDTEKLYAGESFHLNLKLRNTSEREAVKNLQVNFSNEAGVVMPVSGGSNSIFIGDLAKSTGVSMNVGLQIVPDAEPKAQMLNLEITYEGTKNKQEFTEKTTIAIPVLQKTRVRTDAPVFYDDAWVGQSVSMSVQMFNMGKSSLYNCMVEVEGEGLSLEETYYAGNIASGATMRADLTVIAAVAGEIAGNVRITYEDVYGDQSQELLPFTLTVNEEDAMAMAMGGAAGMGFGTGGNAAMSTMGTTGDGAGEQGFFAQYWWVLVIAAGLAVLVTVVAIYKRKRARMLEDDYLGGGLADDDDRYMEPSYGDAAANAGEGRSQAPAADRALEKGQQDQAQHPDDSEKTEA